MPERPHLGSRNASSGGSVTRSPAGHVDEPQGVRRCRPHLGVRVVERAQDRIASVLPARQAYQHKPGHGKVVLRVVDSGEVT